MISIIAIKTIIFTKTRNIFIFRMSNLKRLTTFLEALIKKKQRNRNKHHRYFKSKKKTKRNIFLQPSLRKRKNIISRRIKSLT